MTLSDEARNRIAVMLHYPAWSLSDLEKQARREARLGNRAALREGAQEEREREGLRKYVRSGKHNQMRDWVNGLVAIRNEIRPKLTKYEREFLNKFYVKFKKHSKARWVTESQYALCREIAARFLPLPGRKDSGILAGISSQRSLSSHV
jgi:hypothetical protein